MEAIVEILDSSNNCRERYKLSTLPAYIGRSFTCDVVLADAYVCPRHLEINKSDTGKLVIKDLDSVNGVFLENKKRKISNFEIHHNEELRIGHTLVNVIDPNVEIAATIPFDRPGLWSRKIRFSLGHAFLAFVLFIAAYFIDGFLLNLRKDENQNFEVLISAVVGSFVVFLPWAAIWSLLGKININKPRFYAHFSIPLIASFVYGLIKRGYGYLEYAFAQPALLTWFGWIFAFTAITFLFYYHLLYSTRMAEKRRWIFSCSASILLIIISILVDLKNEFSFSNELPLSYQVKPPWARLVEPSSIDQFTDNLAELKDEL